MRRLLLSSKKLPFSAGPPGSRRCHSHPILSNRLNSIAACGPPYALAPPDSLLLAASLPFALTPLSSCAVPVGFRRSGAAIFQPVSIADRFAIHRSDRWRNAVARTRRLGKQYSGSPPAIRPLAVGPAARLPATGSRQPHTDSSAGPRLGPQPDAPPRLHRPDHVVLTFHQRLPQ